MIKRALNQKAAHTFLMKRSLTWRRRLVVWVSSLETILAEACSMVFLLVKQELWPGSEVWLLCIHAV